MRITCIVRGMIAGIVTMMLLAGCGGSSSGVTLSSGNPPVSGIKSQMGGAIQGSPLSLTGYLTTVAGSPFWVDGVGTTAAFNDPLGIVAVGTALYVTDFNSNTIRRVDLVTRQVSTFAGAANSTGDSDGIGSAARFNGPDGLATDGTYLYVADERNNTIRRVTIATGAVSTIAGTANTSGSADGFGTAARFNTPRGIATDGTNLYVSDSGNFTIRKIVIATGAVTTIAGTVGASGAADGVGAAARFNDPWGLATDGVNLYVADEHNNEIRKLALATGAVTTLAGTVASAGSADGTGASASFSNPGGLVTDGTNLYVADCGNKTVRKVVISTGNVTTLAGTPGVSGNTDASGASARFKSPWGIASDGTNLYLTDDVNYNIRQIAIATAATTTIAGTPPWTDGLGSDARLANPWGIATDGVNVYFTDAGGSTIRKMNIATGLVTTIAGTVGIPGTADGVGTGASFDQPRGITTDGTHLFVTDCGSHTVRKIVLSTGVVTTIAGSPGLSGSADGVGAAARFNLPAGITTDGTSLYLADVDNSTIRKIDIATGTVTTVAGSPGVFGWNDGVGSAARFDGPNGVTTDGTNLYVADTYAYTVRKIVISTGAVTTIAGASGIEGSTDGTGAAARFSRLRSISTDGTNLYVTDETNNVIRKIVISSGAVTTIAGTAGRYGWYDGTGSNALFNTPTGVTTDGTTLFVADFNNNVIRRIQ